MSCNFNVAKLKSFLFGDLLVSMTEIVTLIQMLQPSFHHPLLCLVSRRLFYATLSIARLESLLHAFAGPF